MEGKKYTPYTLAFSMGRIEVIERALKMYKEKMMEDFRENEMDDNQVKVFANDLSKVDTIIDTIEKGKARIAARKEQQ